MTIKSPKKLIEVALPLDDINEAAAREKSMRHGHPSTIHLWWARRPLAAARAILFAQLVNDPGGERGWFNGKSKEQADREREELFQIIRELVKWENTNNKEVLSKARAAIKRSWEETCNLNKGKENFDPMQLPAFHDPFAGGGALPLEAQRLGLESFASDLNPVAVMINKALIEIPNKFSSNKPVGPLPEDEKQISFITNSSGVKNLAEDVRRYGIWWKDEVQKKIGHLYPKIEITSEIVKERPDLKACHGKELTIIAWLWARTVKSPNPAFSDTNVPLVSSFVLSSKKGKEAWVEYKIEGKDYEFKVRNGTPPSEALNGTKIARGSFGCIFTNSAIDVKYIKEEGMEGRLSQRLMAIVAEGPKGRMFLSPTVEMEAIASEAVPAWEPAGDLPSKLTGGTCFGYGLNEWKKVFTPRQLTSLTTFTDQLRNVREKVIKDAIDSGWEDDGIGLAKGGVKATAYGDAIVTYLSFLIGQLANHGSSICGWNSANVQMRSVFARQAIPMMWDFAESNPFCSSSGSFSNLFERLIKGFLALGTGLAGTATQANATTQNITAGKIVSTDPPYYDNIAYADLSDFFYVWMRKSLKDIYPNLFSTVAVPKSEELVATSYRHGGKKKAEVFFLNGMKSVIQNLSISSNPAFPVTIYYAFKQSDTKDTGTASTGWETFLEAVIQAGFAVTGTWPIRSEKPGRSVGIGTNALASSILLVCRKKENNVDTISRREFLKELRITVPEALSAMLGGASGSSPIAPVDLAQAAIGPGIGVFSKYASVLNQDGSRMSVHEALILINKMVTETLTPDAGHYDADTLFCSAWFDQYGWSSGTFGEADTLARAKGTTVDGVREAGVLESGGGKVRLLKWQEYPIQWSPKSDSRVPIWEVMHHLIRLINKEGETAAGKLLANTIDKSDSIRQLAYHLYTLCERHGWAEEARAYNQLITAWSEITSAAQKSGVVGAQVGLEF